MDRIDSSLLKDILLFNQFFSLNKITEARKISVQEILVLITIFEQD